MSNKSYDDLFKSICGALLIQLKIKLAVKEMSAVTKIIFGLSVEPSDQASKA
tara:strand:+ start:164 stop:319 length:156 start_codon:yes stop_codon:yes gene_type:complete